MAGEAECLCVLRRQSIRGRVTNGAAYFVPPSPPLWRTVHRMTPTKKVFCFIVLFLKAALISYTSFSTDAIPLNLTSEMRLMTSFVTVSNKALLMFNGDLTSLFSN